jgi:hypothetical protein
MLSRIVVVSALLVALGGAGATPTPAADSPPIVIDGVSYATWSEWTQSDAFRESGARCATPEAVVEDIDPLLGSAADCSYNNTNPAGEYAPTTPIVLTCVVHVIRTNSGSGDVSDALIQSQIDILNEDFLALAGTNGENGDDAMIQFQLATEDPSGAPTNGITRSNNTTWFNDSGTYYNTLAWDPDRYINIYTNSASGALGYVPFLPQQGGVGSLSDRIVILWSAFGRDAPIGPPYDQGRTLTHEMGHYLGLFHTFQSGCATATPPGCYTTGDRICDTNSESSPTFGCPASQSSCNTRDPFDNYMDYSDDLCMERYTPEQVRRMRCTVEHWRPDLVQSAVGVATSTARVAGLQLLPNRPNPFDRTTEIRFDLAAAGNVDLEVLDVTGRRVRTLAAGHRAAGPHRETWTGTNDADERVAAGVYFVRLRAGEESEIRRMVLLK